MNKEDKSILKYALSIDEKGRVTPLEFATWLRQSLDIEAENLFGEFGYDTCSQSEKLQVIQEMMLNGDFDDLGLTVGIKNDKKYVTN